MLSVLVESRRDDKILHKAYTNLVKVTKNMPKAVDDFKPMMIVIVLNSFNKLVDGRHSIDIQMKLIQLIVAALPILADETVLRANLRDALGEKANVDELVERFKAITDENFNKVSGGSLKLIVVNENLDFPAAQTSRELLSYFNESVVYSIVTRSHSSRSENQARLGKIDKKPKN